MITGKLLSRVDTLLNAFFVVGHRQGLRLAGGDAVSPA